MRNRTSSAPAFTSGSTTEQLSRARASSTLIERLRAHDSCHSIIDPDLLDEAADCIADLETANSILLEGMVFRRAEIIRLQARIEELEKRVEEPEAQVAEGDSAGMTATLADTIDVIVQGICEDCDDETGERMFKAINAVGLRNNATVTMHCAQIIAAQLAELKEGDIRDGYWTAFGRLVLLCMNTP
jgi:hypothetical protein